MRAKLDLMILEVYIVAQNIKDIKGIQLDVDFADKFSRIISGEFMGDVI